ncbi:MAG: ABC transporter permease [Firmicutes bacterium]|nr:ABC transporter permease [Bacillota bacterium]
MRRNDASKVEQKKPDSNHARAREPFGKAPIVFLAAKVRQVVKLQAFGIFMILLVLSGILWITCPETFPTSDNLFSVARQFSYIAITAIGELLVIITGGIDLSVGSIMGIGAVLTGFLMYHLHYPIHLAIIIGVIGGAFFGLLNSLFITKLKLPPFIATLGTLSIGRGLAYAITEGYTVPVPPLYARLGQGYLGPIPYPVIYMVVIGILFAVFLGRTVIGRRIYALGGNEEAAKVSGINVSRLKIIVYMLAGALAAIGGIVCSARLGVAQSTLALGYELDVIAAVFIGGASTSGGSGTVLGTILGAAIMGIIRNGLVLLNVSPYWVQTAIGAVIIISIGFDRYRLEYQQKKLSKGVV